MKATIQLYGLLGELPISIFLKSLDLVPTRGGDSFVIPTNYFEEEKRIFLKGPRMQKKTLNKNWGWGVLGGWEKGVRRRFLMQK